MWQNIFSVSLIIIGMINSITAQQFSPPQTKKVDVVDELHNMKLTDSYQWLEDKKDQEVIDWTRKQHEASLDYLSNNLKEIPDLRDEIAAYLDRDIVGSVFLRADRQFFYKKAKGNPQSQLYTRLDGKDVLIFDPVKIDPSGKSSISGTSYNRKADKVAIGIQYKGAEIQTFYIIDTKTGKQLGKPIEGLRGFSWTRDDKHAYIYVRTKEMIDEQKPIQTFLHTLNQPRSKDKYLFEPDNAQDFLSISDATYSDHTFIVLGNFKSTKSIKFRKTGSDEEAVEIYGSDEFNASVRAIGDKFYILTNDNALNNKIMFAEASNADSKNWKTLIPEGETVIENFIVTNDYILVQDKKDVVSRILAYDLNGKFIKEVPLPEIGNVGGISFHRESNTGFVSISTFTSPSKLYTLDGSSLKWTLYFKREVPLNTDNIEAGIQFYTSKDGTRVPIFVMHKKGLKKDGNNPTLLYGYGGFNIGMAPNFVGLASTFINRGGVYAIACLRGGDEYGEAWHRDGMLFNKQNTFDDFIAAGEFLISEGFTNTEKLAIRGGSNGGLLVGAVITQRPDLFKAAICAVPLLDMIRFPKFLIAKYWIPEYGDPEQKADFQNILSYSPYHNIRMGVNTPTTMVIAGENDTRVDPLHAKKFVAALQNNPGQINPIMLFMDYDSGHGSGKSTKQQIDHQEVQWRFIMRELGM